MQTLLDVVHEFTIWCGVETNVTGTNFLARNGQGSKEKGKHSGTRSEDKWRTSQTLDINDACRYLGYWGTGNGEMSATREVVRENAKVTRDLFKSHSLTDRKCSRHKGWWREGKDELATHSLTTEV